MRKRKNLEDTDIDDEIYTEDGIDEALENDEISLEEAGFMHGFLGKLTNQSQKRTKQKLKHFDNKRRHTDNN